MVTLFSCQQLTSNLIEPSFFFMNNTVTLQSNTLDQIKPLSTSSYDCSFNSVVAIRYIGKDIGVVSRTRLIAKLLSFSKGKPRRSSGNIYGKSPTTGIFSKLISLTRVSITRAKQSNQPLRNKCETVKAYIKLVDAHRLSLKNTTTRDLGNSKWYSTSTTNLC